MILAGIDLAWKGDEKPSAIAVGQLTGRTLSVREIEPALIGLESLLEFMEGCGRLHGVAVDASLIIHNKTGQRPCEKELARVYASRGAACHASNLTLYPDPFSVRFSRELEFRGFAHLAKKQWQIECYPHPSLIEIFSLPKRLKYKKGKVEEKKQGQCRLAELLTSLSGSSRLKLAIPDGSSHHVDPLYIENLKGQSLKTNEDALDAMICLYVAALYASGAQHHLFGNTTTGYIWVPRGN